MTKKISTYKDLLEEKERLQSLLDHQKGILRNDVKLIKEEFEPVRHAARFLKKFTNKDSSNPMLTIASSRLIDLVLRRFVLARAGWVTRLVVPLLAKNFSSHVVNENKTQILGKLATWFNKVRGHKVPRARAGEEIRYKSEPQV